MDLILDTCGLLSLSVLARKKLSSRTLNSISSSDNLYISACSLFEIALKEKRGQLDLSPFANPNDFWIEAESSYELETVAVTAEDFAQAVALPDIHSDPFDRIILAQAMRLKCEIVSYDKRLKGYDVVLRA